MNNDQTMTFTVIEENEGELKKNLTLIYDALSEKGYNPINQIVGYILSDILTEMSFFRSSSSLIFQNKLILQKAL